MLLSCGDAAWDAEKIRLSREEDLYRQEMLRLVKDLTYVFHFILSFLLVSLRCILYNRWHMICRFQRAGEHSGGTTWQRHKQKDKGQYVGCGEHGLDNEQIQVKGQREKGELLNW